MMKWIAGGAEGLWEPWLRGPRRRIRAV